MKKQNGSVENKSSFITGAAVLAVSVIIVKIIGMIYKIVLANFLGGVGNGLFTAAYELYIPLYTLATAGFPIAMSRMISESMALERYRDVKKIYKIALPFFLLAGIVCFLLMVGASAFYVKWIDCEDALPAIICLAPTIFFGCLVSVYRGYFEGQRNMLPTAVSEVIEALSKLVFGLSLAYYVQVKLNEEFTLFGTVIGKSLNSDSAQEVIISYTVAAAILGITVGSFLSFMYVYIMYRRRGRVRKSLLSDSPEPRRGKEILRTLVKIAIPVGLGAIIMSIAGSIDSSLILIRVNDISKDPDSLNCLLKMYDGLIYENVIENGNIHKYLSGCYSYSLTIMMLVTAITQVFGTSALPNVTAAFVKGSRSLLKQEIETVLRVTTMVTIPCGLGMTVLSRPILSLLYSSPNVECEVVIAAKALQVLGITVIFVATSTPICSMLQAVNRADVPLKLFIGATVINITMNYTLIIIPQLNIIGAAIGTLVAYIFVCFAAMYVLCRETNIMPDFNMILVKPVICASVCVTAAFFAQKGLGALISDKVATVISIIIAAIIYIIFMLIVKGITKNDILLLPKGNKIAKTLEKYRLIG
ncbi:MAG: polysaccharide biosynthesis protein [Clostridiales bacterium]|nr:polysaccharide biosynthesis protein [Clostridiales bacterium]